MEKIKKKQLLREALEKLGRGSQTELADYLGCHYTSVQKWISDKGGWIRPKEEPKLWEFLQKKGQAAPPEFTIPHFSQDAPSLLTIEDEDIATYERLALLLGHKNQAIRTHIVNQIRLLSEAEFPNIQSTTESLLHTAQVARKIRQLLTEESAQARQHEPPFSAPLADRPSQGGQDEKGETE